MISNNYKIKKVVLYSVVNGVLFSLQNKPRMKSYKHV